MPQFFDRYINLVKEDDLLQALKSYTPATVFAEVEKLKNLKDEVYAVGKWTIKDILQHCIDTERVMAYRALCISRNDKTSLPGFEENLYAENTYSHLRTVEDLLEEYALVRESTIRLFTFMDNTMIFREGLANNSPITPLALGFVAVGHPIHHNTIIEERYFPLL